jgi:hypothetical protein
MLFSEGAVRASDRMLYSVRVTPAACGRIPLFYLTAHNIRSLALTAPSLNSMTVAAGARGSEGKDKEGRLRVQ